MKAENKTLKLVLTGFFIALGYVLPFVTGQIEYIGDMLCPMHIPVILCGFICGWPYGIAAGLMTPVLRSLVLGMPPMFPTAICMAFELASYGAIAGFLYRKLPRKTINIYIALITAMLAGRVVWGIARFAMTGFDINKFGISAFWTGAFATAIPGIIVQIVLVPLIVIAIDNKKKLS